MDANRYPALLRVLSSLPLDPDAAKAFNDLADAQRGAPEDAMTDIQKLHAGVLAFVVEHCGDLTHRMAERYATDSGTMGWGYVKDKVDKVLGTLEHRYGFAKENEENIQAGAKYKNIPLDEYKKTLDGLLKAYATEHAKLPVYNEVQDLARRAAVYLGEQKWDRAVTVLTLLKRIVDDKEKYLEVASHVDRDASGKILPYDRLKVGTPRAS